MRQRNHAPRFEEMAKMKLQAFRPSNPKSLQSQTSLRSKNRLPLNGLEGCSRPTDYRSRASVRVRQTQRPLEGALWFEPHFSLIEIFSRNPNVPRRNSSRESFAVSSSGCPRAVERERGTRKLLPDGKVFRRHR